MSASAPMWDREDSIECMGCEREFEYGIEFETGGMVVEDEDNFPEEWSCPSCATKLDLCGACRDRMRVCEDCEGD